MFFDPERHRSQRLAGGMLAAAVALGAFALPSVVYGAHAPPRQAEAGTVVAMVPAGQLKRARLMRVEEPERAPEPRAVPVSEPVAEASLMRGLVMALLGAGCLWLAARQRSGKTV